MFNSIENLFRTKHRPEPALLRGLNDEQYEAIRLASLGQIVEADRQKAITLLALTRPQQSLPILREILASPHEDPQIRIITAYQIAQIGEESEAALLETLPTARDQQLQIAIIQSLARVGSQRAIENLKEFSPGYELSVQRLAQFSQTVIAYRLGITGYELPQPEKMLEGDPQQRVDVTILQASAEEMGNIQPWLEKGAAFNLELSQSLNYRIDCGQRHLALVFERSLEEDVLARLNERNRLAGLVASRAETDGSYSTRYLVFTTPKSRSELSIAVHRTDGQPAYAGSTKRNRSILSFELRAVAVRGASPTLIRGSVSSEGVTFEEAWSDALTQAKGTPRVATPPPVT